MMPVLAEMHIRSQKGRSVKKPRPDVFWARQHHDSSR